MLTPKELAIILSDFKPRFSSVTDLGRERLLAGDFSDGRIHGQAGFKIVAVRKNYVVVQAIIANEAGILHEDSEVYVVCEGGTITFGDSEASVPLTVR